MQQPADRLLMDQAFDQRWLEHAGLPHDTPAVHPAVREPRLSPEEAFRGAPVASIYYRRLGERTAQEVAVAFPKDSLSPGELIALHFHPHWRALVVPAFWSIVFLGGGTVVIV